MTNKFSIRDTKSHLPSQYHLNLVETEQLFYALKISSLYFYEQQFSLFILISLQELKWKSTYFLTHTIFIKVGPIRLNPILVAKQTDRESHHSSMWALNIK